MPISSTSRKAGPFYGNGAATTFTFDFKIFEPSELRVVRFSSTLGVDMDLVAGVDYSITLNPDQDEAPGGEVILAVAPAIGDRVVLLSDVPDTQPVDLTNQGGFYPDLLNGGLDRSTIQVQQLREKIGRAIKLPPTAEDGEYVLPLPQGNQLLAWGQDGKTITNLDPGELISVVTYGNTKADVFEGDGTSTAFALSASPGSVNNLAISIDGVVQVPEIDYAWGGGKALSFVVPPPAGTRIFVRYQEALDEGTDVSGKANRGGDNITSSSDWRAALGLGDAATKDIGTVAGSVAAGDDARLAAVELKLDKATAAEDGKFKFDANSQDWTLADEFRQRIYLIRWKRADNAWADAFDLAMTYLRDNGGGDLICPPLDIPLTRTVVVPYGRINIIGNGQGSTVFKVGFNGDVFRFKAASGSSYLASSLRYCSIDYIGGSAPTSGYAVVFDGVGDCRAVSVGFNKTYRGIGFEGNNRNCRAMDCGGSDVVDAEFVIRGGGNQYVQLGTTFDNSPSTISRSVRVVATERVDLDFFTSSHHGVALEVKPEIGGFVQNVFANFNDLDAANGTSVVIDPTNANTVIRNLFFRSGSASASTEAGFHIKSGAGQVGDVFIDGMMIQSNLKEGCIFEKGRVRLSNCLIARNGSNAGQPGMRVKAGCDLVQITGGAIGPILGGPDTSTRPMTLENFQLFGVVFDAGFAGRAVLNGVDLTGNVTGPIQNNSAVTIEVNNCPGYRTRARGVATIPVGAGFVTITPPALAQPITANTPILLSLLSNPNLSGVETVWRGGFTATTFDVVTSPFLNVSGQPLSVAWAVEV